MVFVPSIISNSMMGFSSTTARRYLTSKQNYDGVSTLRRSIYQHWNNSVVLKVQLKVKQPPEMSLPPELDTNRGLSAEIKLSLCLSLVDLAGYTEIQILK